MKEIKNESGFSLAEVMVAAGLIGGLSLALMQITKNQSTLQRKSEIGMEVTTVVNSINQSLLRSEGCVNTIGGVGVTVANDMELTSIKTRRNTDLYVKDRKYNKFEISNITIKNLTKTADPISGKVFGEANLAVSIKKNLTANESSTMEKKFPLNFELDSSDRLQKCYSLTENAIDEGKVQSCHSIGGTYNSAGDNCDLSSSDDSHAASVQYTHNYVDKVITDVLDEKYLWITGEKSMSGPLTFQGSSSTVISSTKIETDEINSKTFSTTGVASLAGNTISESGTTFINKVTVKNSKSGSLKTVISGSDIKINGKTVATVDMLVEALNPTAKKAILKALVEASNGKDGVRAIIDATLNEITTKPSASGNCGTGFFVKSITYDKRGTVTYNCGQAIDTNVFSKSCPTGSLLKGFSALGDPICEYLFCNTTQIEISHPSSSIARSVLNLPSGTINQEYSAKATFASSIDSDMSGNTRHCYSYIKGTQNSSYIRVYSDPPHGTKSRKNRSRHNGDHTNACMSAISKKNVTSKYICKRSSPSAPLRWVNSGGHIWN